MNTLILASSSPYRKALLERLHLPFECINPAINEEPLDHETPGELVQRLALEKAQAVARHHTNKLIIGSDQVALLNGNILTKPGNFDNAASQLRQQSGQRVMFYTGLAVYNSQTRQSHVDMVTTAVLFRALSDEEIENYLNIDKPWNCAGSFKSEGLGISLFEAIDSDDPTALIGLPLIRLCEMLRAEKLNM